VGLHFPPSDFYSYFFFSFFFFSFFLILTIVSSLTRQGCLADGRRLGNKTRPALICTSQQRSTSNDGSSPLYVYVWRGQTGILTAGLSLSLSLSCRVHAQPIKMIYGLTLSRRIIWGLTFLSSIGSGLSSYTLRPSQPAAQHNTWPFFKPVVEKRLFYSIFSVWGRIS
jgi:hypothetical protein